MPGDADIRVAFADFEATDDAVALLRDSASGPSVVPERAPAAARGWLTYDPADVAEVAQQCATSKCRVGFDYLVAREMSDEEHGVISDFVARIKADYVEVEGVTLTVASSISPFDRTGVVAVRAELTPPPPVLTDDTVVIYTNWNVPCKKYRSLVPTEPKKPSDVVVYASDTYDKWARCTMEEHKARRRVMCGKFPRNVKTTVLPALKARGVTVDTAAATFV